MNNSCLLCDSKSNIAGKFITNPTESHSFGGINGRTRIIHYDLCEKCFLLPDHGMQAVEDHFKRYFSRLAKSWAQHTSGHCIICNGPGDEIQIGSLLRTGCNVLYQTCPECRRLPDLCARITTLLMG